MTQITKVLPRSAWEHVIIQENKEPLVHLEQAAKLKLGGVHKQYEPLFLVREAVAQKLYTVSARLPEGIVLVVIEGYRTMQHQQESWDRNFKRVKEDNPDWSEEEIDKKVRLVIARPHPLANHHCGGAIDVTLAYESGELLDMGSPYPSEAYGTDIRNKFPMFPNAFLSKVITKEQEDNRKLLRESMEKEDFVWYPGEWWHYCYGDRMWAVYSERPICFYGPIEP
ncbi:MAG: M15 family metallopeptidase [Candidatus Paceibacterota bacterium]